MGGVVVAVRRVYVVTMGGGDHCILGVCGSLELADAYGAVCGVSDTFVEGWPLIKDSVLIGLLARGMGALTGDALVEDLVSAAMTAAQGAE